MGRSPDAMGQMQAGLAAVAIGKPVKLLAMAARVRGRPRRRTGRVLGDSGPMDPSIDGSNCQGFVSVATVARVGRYGPPASTRASPSHTV